MDMQPYLAARLITQVTTWAMRTRNGDLGSSEAKCRGMAIQLIIALVLSAFLHLGSAEAQQSLKVHRIGYLTISPREAQAHLIQAFERGLAERGYVVGRDIFIEYRFANGKPERLQGLADDLVRAKVDVIVTGINPNIRAAQRATKTIPIVTAISYFPVEEGLVQSLARPGGNTTGLTSDAAEEVGCHGLPS